MTAVPCTSQQSSPPIRLDDHFARDRLSNTYGCHAPAFYCSACFQHVPWRMKRICVLFELTEERRAKVMEVLNEAISVREVIRNSENQLARANTKAAMAIDGC